MRKILGLGLLVLTVTIVGCPGVTRGQILTEADNGTTITVPQGSSFTVRLASNTGFGWSVGAINNAVVAQTSHQTLTASGQEEFTFTGVAQGTSAVTLNYTATGQTTPQNIFTVTVNVTAE